MTQTPHDAITAARALAPELSTRAQEMDKARRLPALAEWRMGVN
ncbi:MAG: hypothetical protein ABJN69_04620 [Hellea sp.]